MRCPTCEAALERKRHKGKALHRCGDCRSYLVPLPVLENILDAFLSAAGRETAHRKGEMVTYLRMHGRMHKQSVPCPSCRKSMVRKSFPAIMHTALDFCWTCRTVWFDRGELGKVAKFQPTRLKAGEPGAKPGGRKRSPRKKVSMKSIRRVSKPQVRGYMSDDVVYLSGFLSAYEAAKRRAREKRSRRKKKKT
jgi:Zn-finger nucleic acid-binding protein